MYSVKIRRKMVELARLWDPSILDQNEINATKLAEAASNELGLPENVLDDSNHEIWDIALDIADVYNKIKHEEQK